MVDRRPAPGETLLGTGFSVMPGGKGCNQAVAAARAGADVEFLGAVGDDTFALELRQLLVDEEIGTQLLREVPGPSGIAAITVDARAENSIVVVSGANSTMTGLLPEELDAIAEADLLLCQFELPLDTVCAAACHARANNTVVILNPSPAQPLPLELQACVDVVVVNEAESAALGILSDVPHVIVTCGAEGARYRGPDGVGEHVPAVPAEPIDTTGAGDAFAGVLAANWHRGPSEALRWASAAGAIATTRLGASMPTQEEIAQLMSSSKEMSSVVV